MSTGTVDRIIHNRGQVSQENIDKVQAIIAEYGYKPNIFASNLAFNKKFNFVVFVPNYDQIEYWETQIKGIQKAAEEHLKYGITLSYHFYNFDHSSFRETAETVMDLEFDGLLFAPIFYEESLLFLAKFKERNIPIVMIDSDIVNDEGHYFVGQNSFQSGYLCGRLISFAVKDIRRVLVIKNERQIEKTSVFLQRIKGFYSFFEENKNLSNFTFSEIIVDDSLNNSLDVEMFDEIDSIFVPNSRAYIVAQFLEKNSITGKRIVGYDLLKKNIEYLKKGFIDFLINQKPENQGYMGIKLLYKKLVLREHVENTYDMPLEIIVKENYTEEKL